MSNPRCVPSYDIKDITMLSILENIPVYWLGIIPRWPQYKPNALTSEPKSRLSGAIV